MKLQSSRVFGSRSQGRVPVSPPVGGYAAAAHVECWRCVALNNVAPRRWADPLTGSGVALIVGPTQGVARDCRRPLKRRAGRERVMRARPFSTDGTRLQRAPRTPPLPGSERTPRCPPPARRLTSWIARSARQAPLERPGEGTTPLLEVGDPLLADPDHISDSRRAGLVGRLARGRPPGTPRGQGDIRIRGAR